VDVAYVADDEAMEKRVFWMASVAPAWMESLAYGEDEPIPMFWLEAKKSVEVPVTVVPADE
jgi:hypothetical protein